MEKIVSILLAIKNKYDNCEIFLFGSRVWGNLRHDSDLDIAIRCKSLFEYSLIEEEIEDSSIIYTLDIINLDLLNNEALKKRILKDGKQI